MIQKVFLEWGSDEGEHELPEYVRVAFLPFEGMVIELVTGEEGSDDITEFCVEIERIVLDAASPLETDFVLHVIPA